MKIKLAAALFCLCLALAAAGEELVDGIAAQVGSEIVLVSEVNQLTAPVEAEMRRSGAPESEIVKIRATVLDRLIERRLIDIVVRRAELQATDAEVDETLATIAEENGLSLEQLRSSVESQGLPFEAYRARIRGEIEQAKVVNGMVASRVRVEESEVRELYRERFSDQPSGGEEYLLRHLLVAFKSTQPQAQARACGEAEQARVRILAGEPFRNVAREISDANRQSGGDIGWVYRGSLAGWMRSAVDALEPGETSEVLETSFGCNLLQLVEKREFVPLGYEEARGQLRKELFDLHMQEEYVEFIDKLRSQTYVERKGLFAETAQLGPSDPGALGGVDLLP